VSIIKTVLLGVITIGVIGSFMNLPTTASHSSVSKITSLSGKFCKVETGGELKRLKASYHQMHQKVVQFLE